MTAIQSFVDAFRMWRVWLAFALEDLAQNYRKSIFGALWIAMSFCAFVLVKILVFRQILGQDASSFYNLYLLIGYFCWGYMILVVNAGTRVFIEAEAWVKNEPIPLPLFALQRVARTMFDFALTLFIVIVFLPFLGVEYALVPWLTSGLALLLYPLTAIWLIIILGISCLRFRDLQHLTGTIMRLAFFLTPIFWVPTQMDAAVMGVLQWNPFLHFIAIVRDPIVYGTIPSNSWLIVSSINGFGVVSAVWLLGVVRKNVVYWY